MVGGDGQEKMLMFAGWGAGQEMKLFVVADFSGRGLNGACKSWLEGRLQVMA